VSSPSPSPQVSSPSPSPSPQKRHSSRTRVQVLDSSTTSLSDRTVEVFWHISMICSLHRRIQHAKLILIVVHSSLLNLIISTQTLTIRNCFTDVRWICLLKVAYFTAMFTLFTIRLVVYGAMCVLGAAIYRTTKDGVTKFCACTPHVSS